MAIQLLVNRGLSNALKNARRRGGINLGQEHRYVIFSDHHKGARGGADDFRKCEETYKTALQHYKKSSFHLVVMGDAEELWEEEVEAVLAAYDDILELEADFYPEHYFRLYGNHDNRWRSPKQVAQYLQPLFPGIRVLDALLFNFSDGNGQKGEIFLAHGHQGDIWSDYLAGLGPLALPFYGKFQAWTGFGRTTPSKDFCLRGEHDNQMYEWAVKQGNLLLIAGHTHRPIWSSLSHLDRLRKELEALEQSGATGPEFARKVKALKEEIASRKTKYGDCKDVDKSDHPAYFNTGCCRFDDGDITGIEIEDNEMRLIKWGGNPIIRTVLEESAMVKIFANL